MTELLPRIKSGWLRATLFFIAAFISSQIFAGIGMVLILIVSGFDLSALSNQDQIMEELNQINFFLPLKIIEFLSVMLCVWLFMRFIDRKPLRSIGLDLKGYENDFELYNTDFDMLTDSDRKDRHVDKWNKLSARMEPSNRADMDFLLTAFPLYQIHETAVWESDSLDRREEDEKSEE